MQGSSHRLRLNQKISFGQNVGAMMTDNPHFAVLAEDVTALKAKVTAFANAAQGTAEARQHWLQQSNLQETAEVEFDKAMTDMAMLVQKTSDGDAAKILSAGFNLRGGALPVGPLPEPVGLQAITNGTAGKVTLRWQAVRGARIYEVQTSPDPFTANTWSEALKTTRSRVTLTGLPSVTRCWFRVRAIGAAGPSAWSDPAIKTVP